MIWIQPKSHDPSKEMKEEGRRKKKKLEGNGNDFPTCLALHLNATAPFKIQGVLYSLSTKVPTNKLHISNINIRNLF